MKKLYVAFVAMLIACGGSGGGTGPNEPPTTPPPTTPPTTPPPTTPLPPSTVPKNKAPVAGFIARCDGLTCTFTNTSTDSDGNIQNSSWNFGDGVVSNQNNPIHTFTAGNTYQVSLSVTDDSSATSTTTLATPTGPYQLGVSFDSISGNNETNVLDTSFALTKDTIYTYPGRIIEFEVIARIDSAGLPLISALDVSPTYKNAAVVNNQYTVPNFPDSIISIIAAYETFEDTVFVAVKSYEITIESHKTYTGSNAIGYYVNVDMIAASHEAAGETFSASLLIPTDSTSTLTARDNGDGRIIYAYSFYVTGMTDEEVEIGLGIARIEICLEIIPIISPTVVYRLPTGNQSCVIVNGYGEIQE